MLYKEKHFYCSEECRSELLKPPRADSALPQRFEIINEFQGVRRVSVPEEDTVVTHVTTGFTQGKDSGKLTVFLCRADDKRPYILCHFHNLICQFSVGLYISPQNFSPLELLPGSSSTNSYADYVESLYNSGIIEVVILHMLSKHRVDSFEKIIQTEKRLVYSF